MPKLYYCKITKMISNNVPVDDNDFIPLYLRFFSDRSVFNSPSRATFSFRSTAIVNKVHFHDFSTI